MQSGKMDGGMTVMFFESRNATGLQNFGPGQKRS
jgi:hypothetical protein